MEPAFWINRWNNNQIGFHQKTINDRLLSYWPQLSLPKGALVLVPLCGKSQDMLWLLGQGYRVLGVELSPVAIQQFLEENQIEAQSVEQGGFRVWRAGELTLFEGDLFDLCAGDLAQVEAVFDRASLIALPPALRQTYASHLSQLLPQEAQWLMVVMEYDQSQMSGPPFSVPQAEVKALFQMKYKITPMCHEDILKENQRFADQGLSRLTEDVYHFAPL